MSEIQYKPCAMCGQPYPATPEYFPRNKSKKFGVDSYCHACNRLRAAQWESDNLAHVRKRQHDYSKKHIDKIRKTKRDWNARNPENVRANKRMSEQRRKARKLQLPNDFTNDDWLYALDYFKGRCAICGRIAIDDLIISMDHWIPMCDKSPDNPGNVPSNIIPLCCGTNGCNNVKKHRDARTWLLEQYGSKLAQQHYERIMEFFKTVRHG